jgi:hypothetical protein
VKETLKFNKSNWSGESIAIEVNTKTGYFKFYDDVFYLKFNKERDTAKAVCKQWEYPLTTGYLHNGIWYFESSVGVTREDKNPFIAAIQVLCNII